MSIAVIAKGAAGGGAGSASLGSLTISQGSTIVAVICANEAGPPSVTYNPGSGAVALTQCSVSDNNYYCSIFYRDNCDSSSNGTVAVSGFGDDTSLLVYEITGALSAGSFDKQASASGRATTFSTGATATLSQANEAIIAGVSCDDSSTVTWTNPTLGVQSNEPENDVHADSAYKTVTATTAQTASGSFSAKQYYDACIATFKEAEAATNYLIPVASQTLQAVNRAAVW